MLVILHARQYIGNIRQRKEFDKSRPAVVRCLDLRVPQGGTYHGSVLLCLPLLSPSHLLAASCRKHGLQTPVSCNTHTCIYIYVYIYINMCLYIYANTKRSSQICLSYLGLTRGADSTWPAEPNVIESQREPWMPRTSLARKTLVGPQKTTQTQGSYKP